MLINQKNLTYRFKDKEIAVLQLCFLLKKKISTFCSHSNLVLQYKSRVCLVEINQMPKLQVTCCLPIHHTIFFIKTAPLVYNKVTQNAANSHKKVLFRRFSTLKRYTLTNTNSNQGRRCFGSFFSTPAIPEVFDEESEENKVSIDDNITLTLFPVEVDLYLISQMLPFELIRKNDPKGRFQVINQLTEDPSTHQPNLKLTGSGKVNPQTKLCDLTITDVNLPGKYVTFLVGAPVLISLGYLVGEQAILFSGIPQLEGIPALQHLLRYLYHRFSLPGNIVDDLLGMYYFIKYRIVLHPIKSAEPTYFTKLPLDFLLKYGGTNTGYLVSSAPPHYELGKSFSTTDLNSIYNLNVTERFYKETLEHPELYSSEQLERAQFTFEEAQRIETQRVNENHSLANYLDSDKQKIVQEEQAQRARDLAEARAYNAKQTLKFVIFVTIIGTALVVRYVYL